MTIRRSLVPVVAAVLLLATACAGDDTQDTSDGSATEQPADDTADEPDDGATDEPADDSADEPSEDTADDGASEEEPGDEDAAAGGTQPATVALTFDGQRVPIATACNGVDGAVLATTEGEVTITLVQEEGVTLRYEAEGATAETDEVTVDESEDDTIYTATLSGEQVDPLAVTLAVASGADQLLPACE